MVVGSIPTAGATFLNKNNNLIIVATKITTNFLTDGRKLKPPLWQFAWKIENLAPI